MSWSEASSKKTDAPRPRYRGAGHSRPLVRLIAPAAMAMLALGGCTFSPVYGDGAALNVSQLRISYAEPASRLEQIVYQDLAFRLGRGGGIGDPEIGVGISSSTRRVGRSSTASPLTTYEVVVTGTATVSEKTGETTLAKGEIVLDPKAKAFKPFSITRTASAQYETSDQRLANQEATRDASERAAHALAESLRLALLAELSSHE